MPPCFTCGQEITFDKTILSKNGKQIPLWPDKQNTHGHDEQGQPIRKPLPETQQQTTTWSPQPWKPEQSTPVPKTPSSSQSQGGSYMDTKRIRVMLEDIGKKQLEHDDIIQSTYALCRNNSNMLVELMNHFQLIETTTAAALHQKQQSLTNKEFMTTDHGKKADDYAVSQTTKFVDETKLPGGFDEGKPDIIAEDISLTADDENDGVSDDL